MSKNKSFLWMLIRQNHGSKSKTRTCSVLLVELNTSIQNLDLGLIKWSLCPLHLTAKFLPNCCTIFWVMLTTKQFSANQMFLWWNHKYKETKAFISSLSASYASSSCETKQAPTTGWSRWGYGTRIQGDKKWVLFCICSQTRGLSDFPHIVAALINVPLWHSKHSAVTNVHLACKVCASTSCMKAPETHLQQLQPINLQIYQAKEDVYTPSPRISSLLPMERFSDWRCAMKTSTDPRPLPETPRMPPQLEWPAPPAPKPGIRDAPRSSSLGRDGEMSAFRRFCGRCREDHTRETAALHQMTDETWCIFLRRHKNARWESRKTRDGERQSAGTPASASAVHVDWLKPQKDAHYCSFTYYRWKEIIL